MAFTIGDLGNGTGYIYLLRKNGAVDTFVNNEENVQRLKLRGVMARILQVPVFVNAGTFTSSFRDDNGDRFFLNADAGAVKGSAGVTDPSTIAITDDIVPSYQPDNQQITISSDTITVERRSPITIISLTPEAGNADVVNSLKSAERPFLQGDIIILTLANETTMDIDINDASVSSGNFRLQDNANCRLKGSGSTLILVKDATTPSFSSEWTGGNWRELARPNDSSQSYAQKNITSGGGTYNVFDATLSAGEYLTTRRGVVEINNNTTLAANFTVQAESPITTLSQKGEVKVIQSGQVVTAGNDYTIFGQVIPPHLALSGDFAVFAWYDPALGDWVSRLVVTGHDQSWVDIDGGGLATASGTNLSSNDVEVLKIMGSNMNSNGEIEFQGGCTLKGTYTYPTGKQVFTNVDASIRPKSDRRFVCPVERSESSEGVGPAVAIVEITAAGVISIYAMEGYQLDANDTVDFSNIRYTAWQ